MEEVVVVDGVVVSGCSVVDVLLDVRAAVEMDEEEEVEAEEGELEEEARGEE